ncbi:hypothetical protein HYU17_05555 [Candidatus Woesearchaeota archaeon]|nr:hypothetical protein [Candidatus Woesearchaeota archaeon]
MGIKTKIPKIVLTATAGVSLAYAAFRLATLLMPNAPAAGLEVKISDAITHCNDRYPYATVGVDFAGAEKSEHYVLVGVQSPSGEARYEVRPLQMDEQGRAHLELDFTVPQEGFYGVKVKKVNIEGKSEGIDLDTFFGKPTKNVRLSPLDCSLEAKAAKTN